MVEVDGGLKRCKGCAAAFTRGNSKGRPRSYCPSCRVGSSTTCPGCEQEFVRRHNDQRFCGNACSLRRFNSDTTHQSQQGRKGGKVRGEQLKSERQTDWYLKVDGRHVHRTVAETVLGRSLLSAEIVHHEDENKHNNDPTNLIVFPSQADHARHHKLGHPGHPCDCPGIRLKEVMA